MSKNTLDGDLLPEGITVADLRTKIQDTENQYTKVTNRMAILDGCDRGKMWETVKAKFPKFQLTPDTNWVNYIKDNLVASIYTTGRYADLFPKSKDDVAYVTEINAALESIWDSIGADYYQFKAGERAALFNLGITMVGWRQNIVGGTHDSFYQGDIMFKNIDPAKFRRDPYADTFKDADFCYYFDDFHLNQIKSKEIYKERIAELTPILGKDLTGPAAFATPSSMPSDKLSESNKTNNKYHRLTYFYINYMEHTEDKKSKTKTSTLKVAEIHLLDDTHVLYCKKDLKPRRFPFALLYCNEPGGDLVGTSEPAKIFSNALVYNLLNSIYATYAYKAQSPSRFVNVASGINLRQFSKYGNDANKTFPVNGDARSAVHYAEYPPLPPELLQVQQNFGNDIQRISSIDSKYTGKDTASIQTTGGMENMLAQSTMRDNQKILLYERYSKELTELVMLNMIEFGDKRTYTVRDPMSPGSAEEVEIDFPKIDDDIRFRYSLDMQTYLPRTKQRLAATATMLMEKQAQYQPDPAFITPEEWLLCQDLPMKDMIFKRMNIQRNTSISAQVAQSIEMFATLVEGGVDADAALDMVADALQEQQTPNALGSVAEAPGMPGAPAGSPQAAQMGSDSPMGMDIPDGLM